MDSDLLRTFGLPEHAPQDQLRALTRVAAALCGVPTAVVNLLDDCFQHQVGAVGFEGGASDRSTSMCAATAEQPRLRYLPDAALEPAFAGNPWVDGRRASVRFYASAPLLLPDGRSLGSLCVFSHQPATLDQAQRAALVDLAGQVVFLLDQGRRARAADRQAALFRLVAEGSADVLSRHRPDGTALYVSPSVRQVLGLDASGELGRAPGRHVHPEDTAALRAATRTVLSGQRDRATATVRARHADGSERWLEVQLAPIPDESGSVVEIHSAARDVTERRRAEDALTAALDDAERRAALLAAVLETIDVGVVACDAAGYLSLFNQAARDYHGRMEDPTVAAQDWAGRYGLYTEDGSRLLAPDEVPLAQALADGELHDTTIVIAPDDGDARTVRCDGRAMRDRGGRLLGAVVAMKDITQARARARELTEARDQALAGTRAKTAFLAAASHEIRTPLNGVLGALELLSLQQLTDLQSSYVAAARRSGGALLGLLNDVLDLSKAETTSVVLARAPFRPAAVAEDVVAALGAVALGKGIALTLRTGHDEAAVGDAARLRQVLMNLVGNAVKFTSSGKVTVAVDARPGDDGAVALRLAVTDTGEGMTPQELAVLFQPFVQGAQGLRHGGTGLGLALTQRLVDLMGGRLEVDSSPGQGSTFTVSLDLPSAPADSGSAAERPDVRPDVRPDRRGEPSPHAGPADGSPRRVLVADDSEVNLMVAEALLATLGAEVVTVADGDEAVRAAKEAPFDLVLLDNHMTRVSGVEAARQIRQLPGAVGRVRLVALTASAGDAEAEQFRRAGMDDVLVKPVQLADLQRALAAVRP